MTRDMDLDEVLQEIVSLVRAFLNCDSCLIYLKEDEELVLFASSDGDRKNLGRVRLRLNEGLTGWVARERRLLAISREAYSDPRFKFFSDLPEDTYEAFLSVPITARQVTLGVINVQHRAPHAHTGDQMEALSSIGELIGCLVLLADLADQPVTPSNYAELALRSVPIAQES